MKFDFLARQAYYVDHLAPIWNTLQPQQRGSFFCLGTEVQTYAAKKLSNPMFGTYVDEGDCGEYPILTAAYGDAVRAADHDEGRQVILLEHGAGLTFGKAAYADGTGQRYKMAMIPVQSQYVLQKVHPEVSQVPHPIIGVPKMDKWFIDFSHEHVMPKRPTVALTFHHGDQHSRPAEVGSAWEHYIDVLPLLGKRYRLLVHAHPSSAVAVKEACALWGIEMLEDYDEVFRQADILVNDCGSAAYEFCATGKPVILLNAPWFDRKARWGIRFWDYANIGLQVDEPEQLEQAIERVMLAPDEHRVNRHRMVHDLFAYFGASTLRMLNVLHEFEGSSKPKMVQHSEAPTVAPKPVVPAVRRSVRTSTEQGIIYMCFGGNAALDMTRSIESLRNTGSTLPVAVVADQETLLWARDSHILEDMGVYQMEVWKGQDPFDTTKNSHFQFRAGRVKPFLFYHTPFKQTMYVDTDTEFMLCPDAAFGFLQHWDFVIAQERLLLSQLYNKRGAGWEHDIAERDATVQAFGADNGDFPFWNSGVFFWKDSQVNEELFKLWQEEWLKFQGWDEQKALMRAANRSKTRVLVLGEIWNFPHRQEMREVVHENARIILHEYGRGTSRVDIQGDPE